MLSVFPKKRAVICIDLSDSATGVLVSSHGEQFLLEQFEFYSEQGGGWANLRQGYKPEAISAVLGDVHTLCFAVPALDSYNIEIEKRKRGVANESQYSDHLNVSNGAILAATHRQIVQDVLQGVKSIFPGIPVVISQSLLALLYIYLRSYHLQPELRVALLHWSSRLVSLLVVQAETPMWTGSIEIIQGDSDAIYSEIYALLQTANEKTGVSNYDLLLLAGDCDDGDARALHTCASRVELFSPFRRGAFELGKNLGERRNEAQLRGHRLAVAIGGAGLLLERVGINLAGTGVELCRELPVERPLQNEQTALGLALDSVGHTARKVIPFLLQQSKLIAATILISLAIFGYRFWSIRTEMAQIDADIAKEQQRAASLAEIRASYNDYTSKIAAIRERSAAINEIRKNQLAVKTVLDALDERIPKGIIFTELDVQETIVKLKGYAPDRFGVNKFATQLGQSLGVFADVVPVYDDKSNTGNYEISCKYIGPIPTNPLIAVQSSAAPMLAKAKE